jgi:hypothetical protein
MEETSRPVRRKSTVTFNERTVYHEYKANSGVKKRGTVQRDRDLVYGGRGDNPGQDGGNNSITFK